MDGSPSSQCEHDEPAARGTKGEVLYPAVQVLYMNVTLLDRGEVLYLIVQVLYINATLLQGPQKLRI